jgi:hypothetical protein
MKKIVADFYREVSPPDQLSSYTQGTPVGRSDNPDGESSQSSLPNGDSARNIGRPSPDSPNLKYRNLDRAESNGRTPAEIQDLGYVQDSGSGSARVIPYNSGFANNSSALRKAGGAKRKNVPVNEKLWAEIQALAKGDSSKPVTRGKESVNPVNEGKGFTIFPSAYANGWALAQYKRLGGKWKKEGSEFKMPRKWDKDYCEEKPCSEMRKASDQAIDLQRELESEYDGLTLTLSDYLKGDEYYQDIVQLHAIHFPKEMRKQGLGSQVMFDIAVWADKNNKIISLTPSKDFGATSVSRLRKFYGQFGFKRNLGRNKDYRTSDAMIRYPKTRKASDYKTPRKWDKEHCVSKPCDEMGFSEKASCRPYKNCYSKTGASPIRIDRAPLLARTKLAWDKVVSYAEKAQEQGKATISKVIKPVPAFELPHLEIGGQKVDLYVVVKKSSDLVKGEFNRSDNSITINIRDYSSSILNTLAQRYFDFEGDFKKSFLSTLSHEVTHAYERILYTLSGGGGNPNDLVSFKRYINSPSEVKAHLQQVAFEAEEYLVAKHSLTREAIRDHFREALSHRGSKWNEISHLLTLRNKKYMERATLTHLLERADIGMRSASEKEAGLITPPQDLLDEVAEIAQGGLAEHLFFLRTLSPYTEEEIELLDSFSEGFSYLPKGIKRGEEELEDIQLLIMNTKNFLKSLEKKAEAQHLPLIKEAQKEVSSYDPLSVLELFEVYEDSVKRVSNIFFRIHAEASSNTKGLILESSEVDYERALKKNSHRPKSSRGGYNWRVNHPFLSIPLYVELKWGQGLKADGSYMFGNKAHVITIYFDLAKSLWVSHDLKKVRNVARHELVHLMQKEIALKANLIKPSVYGIEYMDTGMPRKKYDTEYRQPNMFNAKEVKEKEEQLKSLREQYRREGFDPRSISIHALDDIEFYTRLLDEIMDFRDNFGSRPDNKSVQRFISLSQFFRSLKRYKPRNWKKAVGLFYEAVNKENFR